MGFVYLPHGETIQNPVHRQPKYSILPLPWSDYRWTDTGEGTGKRSFSRPKAVWYAIEEGQEERRQEYRDPVE